MPRAALLSIHARVAGTNPTTPWSPSLVQLWGPRYSVFVVPARDVALFTLGVYPEDEKGRLVAEDRARRIREFLGESRALERDVGHALGINPNGLKFASPTGTVLIHWDGARQPVLWSVPAPKMQRDEARRELARRYIHVCGPATPDSFGRWSGMGARHASATFEELRKSLLPVRTPAGDAWILAGDEQSFRRDPTPAAPARLLPSGDSFTLLHGADRELLIPDSKRRGELWTPRVWPGALLVDGDIAGTWRRAGATVTIQPWIRLTRMQRESVDSEAASLPLPGIQGTIRVRWEG